MSLLVITILKIMRSSPQEMVRSIFGLELMELTKIFHKVMEEVEELVRGKRNYKTVADIFCAL
jgi:hypothetical protein